MICPTLFPMKDLITPLLHLLTTIARLLGPGGAQAIVADSLLMKQQLLIVNRSRKRAPNLTVTDRVLLGFWSLFLSPRRIRRSAIILKSSTLLRFHEALMKRKYQLLYSAHRRVKPRPKLPVQALNRRTICPRPFGKAPSAPTIAAADAAVMPRMSGNAAAKSSGVQAT